MIVRNVKDIKGTERDVAWGNGRSRRFLLEKDKVGFTVCEITVDAGTESFMEYKNHIEACYCVEGEGEIEDEEGNVYKFTPGALYALDKHDKHKFRAKTKMKLVSIFFPALVGKEKHNLSPSKSSSY